MSNSEVGLNHVGLVLGIEMSRLARSCKDWYQLLELCTVVRTLLADQDREYDPCEYSDRLLLGLSGLMSEAELHIATGMASAKRPDVVRDAATSGICGRVQFRPEPSRSTSQEARRPGTGQVRVPMERWHALVHEKWPAYISWQQFLANQQRLQSNRAGFDAPGAPREGASLLGGLVRCGKCGWRMYAGCKKAARYICGHDAAFSGRCQGQNLVANVVDELVSRQVLLAVEPAAVELSLKAEQDCRKEYQRPSPPSVP